MPVPYQKWIVMTVGITLLGACASNSDSASPSTQVREASQTASQETRDGISDAASAPLGDLNLRREPIPAELAVIRYPYRTDQDKRCRDIAREVARLDGVLGVDYDTIEDAERTWGERGGEFAADLVLDGVRGLTTGFIPYRGLVREVTGAASHERKRERAFAAGAARRSYLKGLGQGIGCEFPAAPAFTTVPEHMEDTRVETPDLKERPMRRWSNPSPSGVFSDPDTD